MKNRSRHNSFLFIICLAVGFSCRKFVEQKKTEAARSIITEGTWRVSKYYSGDSDVTTLFNGYQFQFREDGTVDGMHGPVNIGGTWSVDLANRTIHSAFPIDQIPLSRLNYIWKITDSYNDSVSASTGADMNMLRLELHKN